MSAYTQRLNAFKPTITWNVGADGLVWGDDKGGAGNIPWEKIKSVRLRYEPSRAETRRVAMHIHAPFPYIISNIHFQGPMNFKAQKHEFRDFVLAFHDAFPIGTQTEFHKGSTRAAYVGNVIISLVVLAFLFLLAPLLALTGVPGVTTIVRIGLILVMVPVLLSVLVKNKPDIYDPRHVPLDMLV
ncbi:MAG TPA: hypothetical protein ENJ42_02550 [Hellea balneolensis]|uniref:Uncharacterized protein n=1 Tax=Hellea balneolensis TaxID=287478 RepID=A0A7C5LYQ7_9PROT|nr:hypothetical protein [Hellea balneolensis]